MAKSFQIYVYYCIMIAIFSNYCASDDYKCEQSECLCEFNNKQYLDISNLQSNFTTGNLTYYFNGCNKRNSTNAYQKAALCLFDKTQNVSTVLADTLTFYEAGYEYSAYNIRLTLKNTTANYTITLVCTKGFSPSVFTNQNLNDKFYIFSNYACVLTPAPGGLSTGSTLLILFLIGCVVYFVGGAIVLHCIRGARGKEMIPNIDFWQNLPGLMKDGLIFMLNGCRPTSVATAECYDRI